MNNKVSSVVWPWREKLAGKPGPKNAGPSWIAVVIQVAVLFILGLLSYRKHPILGNTLWGLALLMIVFPPVFATLQRFGKQLGKWVGAILTWGLLVPFFYLCFVPMRLIQMLGGRDPLHRKFPTDEPTYWIPRKPVQDVSRYGKQF